MATATSPLSDLTATSGASASSANPLSGIDAKQLASGVDFFKLLAAQMSAQDPMQPVDNTQFLSQLAQYSQLQQTMSTNQTLSSLEAIQQSMSSLQTMTQTASMIGRSVDYTDPSTGETKTGTVQGVSAENGLVVLEVDGQKVPLTAVTAVREGS